MRALIQRVEKAFVKIEEKKKAEIGPGFLVLLGVGEEDGRGEARRLAEKVVNLRVLEGEEGKMNLSPLDKRAEIMVVPQFTLFADSSKGRRPSFNRAAGPEKASSLYDLFVREVKKRNLSVKTGEFGASMEVGLVNDGPVTIILDTDQF